MTPRRDTPAAGPASSLASGPGGTRESTSPDVADLASLVVELQARGLRVEVPLERRQGGAGPSDSGMLWVGGIPLTVPTDNATAAGSPVRPEGGGRRVRGVPRRSAAGRGVRPAASTLLRPHHGRRDPVLEDRPAAPGLVRQHRRADLRLLGQRRPVQVLRHRRLPRRRPHHRQEEPRSSWPRWPVPPRELDGAVDATLTTGSSRRGRPGGPLRGQVRAGRQGRRPGCPSRCSSSRRRTSTSSTRSPTWASTRSASTSSRSTRRCCRTSRRPRRGPGSSATSPAWERAVALFGEGQVSTYVILGMGEDPELTVEGCRRAVDMGVSRSSCRSDRSPGA